MRGRIPDHLLDICIYIDKLGIQTRCVVAPSCRSDSAAIAPGESLLHHRLGTFGELITGETVRQVFRYASRRYLIWANRNNATSCTIIKASAGH